MAAGTPRLQSALLHSNRARRRTLELHVPAELKSRGNDHSSPGASEGNPLHLPSALTRQCLFSTSTACAVTHVTAVFPSKSKGQAYLIHAIWAVCLVTQSSPTLCDSMDCSPPGSSAHGDSPLQARILERVIHAVCCCCCCCC